MFYKKIFSALRVEGQPLAIRSSKSQLMDWERISVDIFRHVYSIFLCIQMMQAYRCTYHTCTGSDFVIIAIQSL